MQPRTMYTQRELVAGIIRDLVVDIRCAERDAKALEDQALDMYALMCRSDLKRLWRVRHTVRLDRYGWPVMTPPLQAP